MRTASQARSGRAQAEKLCEERVINGATQQKASAVFSTAKSMFQPMRDRNRMAGAITMRS